MDVGLVILDGWGENPDPDARDAVRGAETPTFDRLHAAGAAGSIETHGRRVGLPAGQMGNSEVGHLTIGAGRVVYQESARVTDAIRRWRGEPVDIPDALVDPPLDENEALTRAFEHVAATGGRVHLLGLVSDGGVHAAQTHLHALIDLASERDVPAVTHAFTDGRDTPPTSGVDYLEQLETHVDAVGTGTVATVSGRYYAMDRDGNWDRTRRAYDAIVARDSAHTADSAVGAVRAAYDRGETDEFVQPTLVRDRPPLAHGDALVFANYRADRARQLTRMLTGFAPPWDGEPPPAWQSAPAPPDVRLVTLTEYDETFDVPVAFPPRQPAETLGEVLAETGHTQLRIAETEKYAHVTYFLNGGRELEFPGEHREIVQSPDVATYDLQPEMSAPAVTDRAIDVMERTDPAVVILNYANPDMVGHTGDFEAAVAAIEAVDAQLARLVGAMRRTGGHVLVTADHGNAEDMGTPENPHTAHTTNPVPLVYLAAPHAGDDEPRVEPGDDIAGGYTVRPDGGLADVAPTILALMEIPTPPAMTGTSLLAED